LSVDRAANPPGGGSDRHGLSLMIRRCFLVCAQKSFQELARCLCLAHGARPGRRAQRVVGAEIVVFVSRGDRLAAGALELFIELCDGKTSIACSGSPFMDVV